MKCCDCPFLWADDGGKYPYCHYESLGTWDPAPCEQEDAEEDAEKWTMYCDVPAII